MHKLLNLLQHHFNNAFDIQSENHECVGLWDEFVGFNPLEDK